jgi:transposase
MREIECTVARKAKAMTRNEVVVRAIAGDMTWIQAAQICGISDRQMRRLKQRYEERGYDGLVDYRGGRPRRRRIALETIETICRLKRDVYAEFSVQHFWEQLTEKHKIEISYTWTNLTLQTAGLAEKSPARGKYRRRRERRAMVGMMLHMDASTHQWIEGLEMYDADSRILYARFVAQEGTEATLAALAHVLCKHGRFCQLYTDRGSHFCHNPGIGQAPVTTHQGHVSRALKALGIEQILARSPEARGRSERTFGTIQGRLPQELKLAGITDYEAANEYLQRVFVPDFNRRFTVKPAQAGSAFVLLAGVDLDLLLSVQHARKVNKDSTVSFEGRSLQLPESSDGRHYARCPVIVHQMLRGTLAISYLGRELARYDSEGHLLKQPRGKRRPAIRERASVALRAPSSPSRIARRKAKTA